MLRTRFTVISLLVLTEVKRERERCHGSGVLTVEPLTAPIGDGGDDDDGPVIVGDV